MTQRVEVIRVQLEVKATCLYIIIQENYQAWWCILDHKRSEKTTEEVILE